MFLLNPDPPPPLICPPPPVINSKAHIEAVREGIVFQSWLNVWCVYWLYIDHPWTQKYPIHTHYASRDTAPPPFSPLPVLCFWSLNTFPNVQHWSGFSKLFEWMWTMHKPWTTVWSLFFFFTRGDADKGRKANWIKTPWRGPHLPHSTRSGCQRSGFNAGGNAAGLQLPQCLRKMIHVLFSCICTVLYSHMIFKVCQ